MTVIDVSNWQLRILEQQGRKVDEWAACLAANGVERAIVGCWDYEATRTLVVALRSAGILVEDLYAFLYYGLPHEAREVDHALAHLRGLGGIDQVWLDCEAHWGEFPTEAQDVTVGYRIAVTARERARIAGELVGTGIYTGYYWWRDKMANYAGFAEQGDPLWFAYYPVDKRPIWSLAADYREGPFGGWMHTSVHQYTSDIELCGQRLDHNYWFLEDDVSMTPAEKEQLLTLQGKVARLENIVAGYGIFPVVARGNNLQALAHATGAASLQPGTLYELTGEQTLRYLGAQGTNAYLGLLDVQDAIAQLAVSVQVAGLSGTNADEVLKLLEEQYMELAEGVAALRAKKETPHG